MTLPQPSAALRIRLSGLAVLLLALCPTGCSKEKDPGVSENSPERTDESVAGLRLDDNPPYLQIASLSGAVPVTQPVARIFVSKKGIWVNEDEYRIPVKCKRDGRSCTDADYASPHIHLSVDPTMKEDGREESMLLVPLMNALKKSAGGSTKALLIADKRIPFQILTEVVYTAGMAGVVDLAVAVRDPDTDAIAALDITFPQMPSPPPAQPVSAAVDDPLVIRENTELQLPRSNATFPALFSVPIRISKKEITVDGKFVVPLKCKLNGLRCKDTDYTHPNVRLSVDPMNKLHGRRESLLIVPLKEALERSAKRWNDQLTTLPVEVRDKYKHASHVATVVCDRQIPYATIAEVVTTAGEAGFYDLRFAVRDRASQIRIQRVAEPRRSTGRIYASEKTPGALHLTVAIRQNEGFTVSWEQGAQPAKKHRVPIGMSPAPAAAWCAAKNGKPGCVKVPGSGRCECYDVATLYNTILKIRKDPSLIDPKRPEKRIHIAPDSQVSWDLISRTIDSVRCRMGVPVDGKNVSEPSGGFTGMEHFARAEPILGPAVRLPGMGADESVRLCKPLFEMVVFGMAGDSRVSREQRRRRVELRRNTILKHITSAGPNSESGQLCAGPFCNQDVVKNSKGEVTVGKPGDIGGFKGQAVLDRQEKGLRRLDAGKRTKRLKTGRVTVTKKTAKQVKMKLNIRVASGRKSAGPGKLDGSTVTRVFRRKKGAFRYCYEKRLKVNPNLKGKVVIRFTIGTSGRITNINVTSNSTQDTPVAQCIIKKVKSWKFSSPEGGSATFTYPIVLSKG